MSAKELESVLTRAMSDTAFADLLFADPEKALAGCDLTPEELAALKTMNRAEFAKATESSPEERKSFMVSNIMAAKHQVDRQTISNLR